MSDDVLRDLVEGERAALAPPEGAKQATWGRVARSVAIAAPVLPAASVEPLAAANAAATSGAKWWTTWWANGIFALAIGGATVGGVLAIKADREADDLVPPVAASDDAPAPKSPAAASSRADVEAEIAVPEEVDDAPVVTAPPNEETPEVARVVRPRASKPDAAAPSSALAEEARLLSDARRELKLGHPRAALDPLEEHARRFAQGQLAEERMALTARALCEAGEVERGREQAAALRDAYPSSSHLARVDRTCG